MTSDLSQPDGSEWYVLVGLTAPPEQLQRSDFYVMPRDAVAIALHLHNAHYLSYTERPTRA